MLILHEEHAVLGSGEAQFEAALRDGWMPALGRDGDARLLYVLRLAHGTGESYRVVTLTAVRDGAAWERLARRVLDGDLAAWAREVDGLRHEVRGKLLSPLPWSPLQSVDLDAVPVRPDLHALTLFMEDTVWPHEGALEAYVERSGSHYAEEMRQAGALGPRLLSVDASFRTTLGAHRRREVVLWQKVVAPERLSWLLANEVPEAYVRPGAWMHDALVLRDQWRSRLLRTVAWSPWW